MELTVGVNPIVNEFVKDGKQFISVVFDLQNPVNDECYHYVKVPFGSGHRISVTPSEGYVISGIIYGSNEIFMCDSSLISSIELINIYYYDQDIFLSVTVGNKRLGFGKVGESFLRLTAAESYYRMTRMGMSCTLDINQTKSTREVRVSTNSLYGRRVYYQRPRCGTKVDKLVDGETTIWKDCTGDDVMRESLAIRLSNVKLVSYRIDNYDETKTSYCISDGSGYYNVLLDEFVQCILHEDTCVGSIERKKEEMSRGTIA
ncbi:hypothetical protein BgAZ_200820 [Babesia gibsoni]|uniref:Uncharacterized protein n=1 Tax=Babesia gibsoni TaxID=33632 RepID=A0AAD8PE48_BABGI|nr:hypothetical protein BgAZ_200820 [Babesia gibsoni]